VKNSCTGYSNRVRPQDAVMALAQCDDSQVAGTSHKQQERLK
jgi:hypothetical protein